MTPADTITVAIPTFNGEEFLEEVLQACLAQQATVPFEILVIDSGSTDRTLEIVRRHSLVRLVEIPNHEFGHGRTRNLGTRLARGEVVVFLTQDATPVGSGWLAGLLRGFNDPAVAGVCGKQIPRPHCCPTVSRDVIEAFRQPPATFFSNVNSAVRRSVAEQIPFRDVSYAEDLAFAHDAIAAGHRIAYAPDAPVWHSHDLTIPDYFRRMYDEARGVRESGGGARRGRGLGWLLAATVRGTAKDWWFIVTHRGSGGRTMVGWIVKSPLYNIARRVAIWLAYRKHMAAWLQNHLSLDIRRRKSARAVEA